MSEAAPARIRRSALALALLLAAPAAGEAGLAEAAPAVATAAPPQVAARPPLEIHEVQPGETLWLIAQNTVGDGALWPVLYRANRDQIKDPARVYPGQRLAIPEIGPEERRAAREPGEAPRP